MSNITLHEVAEKAGVSVSTVSRALNQVNGTIPLSARTIERVRAAAAELGYTPNAGARMLRTGRSRTIGILGNDAKFFSGFRNSSFVSESMAGLIEGSVTCGYHLCLLTGIEQAQDRPKAMPDLGMVDGLLVFNRDLEADSQLVANLERSPLPVVYALDYPDDPQAYLCTPDDTAGGRMATELLLSAGHRRIGFVRHRYYKAIFDRREQGWRTALRQAGIEPQPDWIFQFYDPDPKRLQQAALTAVVCCNDHIAVNFTKAASEAGLSIPERMMSISFGNLAVNSGDQIAQAQVSYALAEVAATAVRTLIDLIEGRTPPQRQIFPYLFLPGSSFQPHRIS